MNIQELYIEYSLLKEASANTYKRLHSLSSVSMSPPFEKEEDNNKYYEDRMNSRKIPRNIILT